jgi:acetylornithine deacetylase/succinyl-diaminopimelate desuccinylase-like protein
MPTSPLSAVLEVIRRDSRLHHDQSAVVGYLMDLLYYGEFRIFEQVSSDQGGDAINLIGTKGAGDPKDALWLVANLSTGLDAVPAPLVQDDEAPLEPKIDRRTNAIKGLGACSGKVDAVLMALAASRLRAEELKRPLTLAFVSGEEGRGGSLAHLLEDRRPRAAIVGAPTSLELWSAHPGLLTLEVRIRRRIRHRRMPPFRGAFQIEYTGKGCHALAPAEGRDSIAHGLAILDELKRAGDLRVLAFEAGEGATRVAGRLKMWIASGFDQLPRLPPGVEGTSLDDGVNLPFPVSELLDAWQVASQAGCEAIQGLLRADLNPSGARPPKSVHCGRLYTGRDEIQGNLAFWTGPGVDGGDLVERFATAVEKALSSHDELDLEIHVGQDRPAYQLDIERAGPLVAQATEAARNARVSPRVSQGLLTTDAGTLAAAGVPTIVLGPGDGLGQMYQTTEQVKIAEVEAAAAMFAELVARQVMSP